MRYLCMIVLLLAMSCNQDSVLVIDTPLNQELTLAIGQQASVDQGNLVVTLTGVPEDSRCPIDAVCIWAGNGKVALNLRRGTSANVAVTLNTMLDPHAVAFGIYEIRLTKLTPEPFAGHPVDPADYRATLLVSRK